MLCRTPNDAFLRCRTLATHYPSTSDSVGITQCCLSPDTSERRVSTLSYAPTPSMTGHRSRTCSVLSTGDVLGSAALAAAALLPDVAAAAALATKEVAVYRVMMLGGPNPGDSLASGGR